MSKVANFKRDINDVKNRLENFKITDDLDEDQRNLEEIEEEMRRIEGELDVAEEEMKDDEESNRPLLDKFKEQKSELDVLKNSFQKIQQNFTDAHRDELLKRDKLTGAERKKAQNDMAKDLVKETDRQGLMLEDVHKKVIGANQDLTDMSVEAQKQGEKIGNLGEHVIEMDQSVKKTGNTMSEIEGRICCRKFVLCLGIFILFLLNIIFVFLILAKRFGWSFKPDSNSNSQSSPIKGIQFEQYAGGSINYDDFKGQNLTFVMLKLGESSTETLTDFITQFDNAKQKGIKVGGYWRINNAEEAINAAKKANNFLIKLKEDKKLPDYDFYLKFEENNELLNNYTQIDALCAEIKEKSCGISLPSTKYEYFKTNIDKIKNVKSFWVETVEGQGFDDKNAKNLAFWKTAETVTISNSKYPVIMAK